MRKYITITRGRKPTTAPTPPMIPSTIIDLSRGAAFAISPSTHAPSHSMRVTSPGITSSFSFPSLKVKPSAIQAPSQDWDIWNTRNITTAKIGRPAHLFVRMASISS